MIKKALDNNDLILMEGAVVEILRRSDKVTFHSDLIHSHLIYDRTGIKQLTSIFNSYLEVAKKNNLPFIMCTPTWRANFENIQKSGVKTSINIDAVKFVNKLRLDSGEFAEKVMIGGMIGPKNDCYSPDLGLSVDESESFHSWQIKELMDGGVDFIIAETLPNINEALGIAKAASKLNIDYILSFVISRDGKILDKNSLLNAIKMIDKSVSKVPVGYSVNCAHPSFLCADNQPKEVFERLVAFLANASSLDHCDLENAAKLEVDSVSEWGKEMLRLNRKFGVQILGGCCGTDYRHIEYLTNN